MEKLAGMAKGLLLPSLHAAVSQCYGDWAKSKFQLPKLDWWGCFTTDDQE